MNRKILISIGLALALMLTVSGTVLAAPAAQETTPFTGTVQSITLETDATTLETTVLVEVLDDTGATQTVRLSVEDAASLGLVTLDPVTGDPLVNDAAVGGPVSIDPAVVIGDEESEEAQHPVAFVLSKFFEVNYETIMTAHDEEGVGFGVIAQALWMSQEVDGGAEMFTIIVEAKKSGDYSAIPLPDGSTAQNWGQFKKAILQKGQNLGQVMSGHAESGEGESEDTLTTEGSEDAKNHGQQNKGNHGLGNDKGKGKNK